MKLEQRLTQARVMETTERITMHAEDWWTCLCGNEPHLDGFYPCLDNGDEVEPDVDGPWETLYVCNGCGRIIDQTSGAVVGTAPAERVRL